MGPVRLQSQCCSGKAAPVGCVGAARDQKREVSCSPVRLLDPVPPFLELAAPLLEEGDCCPVR